MRSVLVLAVLTSFACARDWPEHGESEQARRLHARVRAARQSVSTPLARRFLAAIDAAIDRPPWHEPAVINGMPQEITWLADKTFRFGRPLDILARIGFRTFANKRIVHYGDTTTWDVGEDVWLAQQGAQVVVIDINCPIYETPRPPPRCAPASVCTIVSECGAPWPASARERTIVGTGIDLFFTRRVRRDDARQIFAGGPPTRMLGVDDEAFLRAVFDALAPGGLLMMYEYQRTPFPRDWYERLGFRVIAFDADDTAAAQRLARAFEKEVPHAAFYTVVEKPRR